MIVLDASAGVRLLLGTHLSAGPLRERMSRPGETLHAPHLIDAEVAHAVRGLVLSGKESEDRGRQAVEDLGQLAMVRYPIVRLLPRIWELRASATAYDAAYLSLAEALDAPLVTTDGRLGRSSGHRAAVEVYG